jgi:hypothetical protein
MTDTKLNRQTLEALLTLLGDDAGQVASLAMEPLLSMKDIDKFIAKHQDCDNSALRRRMHQLANVITRRRLREHFLKQIDQPDFSAWDAALVINVLGDTRRSISELETQAQDLVGSLRSKKASTAQIRSFMTKQGFAVPPDDGMRFEYYCIGEVLETHAGSAVLLCLLTQHIGKLCGWASGICMYEGRFCLVDAHFNVIDVTRNWEQRRLPREKYHMCLRKEIITCILSYLTVTAIQEGSLHELHIFAALLCDMHGRQLNELPYPLGDFNIPRHALKTAQLPG